MEFDVSYEMVASTENDIKHEMVCDFRLGLGAGSCMLEAEPGICIV